MSGSGKGKSLSIRFWEKVTKTDSCWLFNSKRYGNIRVNDSRKKATHVSWFLTYGIWPTKEMLHTCDNPPCIRPDHLFEGDQIDNMADAKLKGRTRGGRPVGKYKGKFLKFSEEEVSDIRKRIADGEKLKDIAKSLGCCHAVVSYINNGRKGYRL